MPASSHPRPEAPHKWLTAALAGPLILLAAWSLQTDAVATRFVRELGIEGVNFRISDLIETALRPAGGAGEREIHDLLVAGVALVLVGAIAYFLLAVFRVFGGRRGGVEGVVQVVFALVMAIAGLQVLA